MPHLLVVDDEQSICWALSKLGKDLGHSVTTAASAEQALDEGKTPPPDVIVLDVRLPGMDGISAIQHFRDTYGQVPIIVITAYGDLETAVEAVRSGAFEYMVKPFDLQVAQRMIERALSASKIAQQSCDLDDGTVAPLIVGKSPAMQEVFKRIALVASSDACVHIFGESGVGKELVARAIHRYSSRSDGPFIPVNLASLSASLAESELFGHVRGAFTGADQARKGFLEQAERGTIFLDEVADVPGTLQIKLLRALEHEEIFPVGADGPKQTDFRIISATNQDLRRRVSAGTFRHDLYHRLITFEIEIPPLRERPDDIAELTSHFLNVLSTRNAKYRPGVSAKAMSEIKRRPWYGNVRELRNAIEHAIILARDGAISPEHLPPSAPFSATCVDESLVNQHIRSWIDEQLVQSDQPGNLYDRFLRLIEPPLLDATLRRCRGQCTAAARMLGMHRTTLRKKLDEYGLGEE